MLEIDLVLADPLQAVGVLRASPRRFRQFLDDLRIAGRIQIVDQILRGHAVHRLGHAVAVSVVDKRNGTAVHRDQMVLRIVGERLAARRQHVAVRVVGLRRQARRPR